MLSTKLFRITAPRLLYSRVKHFSTQFTTSSPNTSSPNTSIKKELYKSDNLTIYSPLTKDKILLINGDRNDILQKKKSNRRKVFCEHVKKTLNQPNIETIIISASEPYYMNYIRETVLCYIYYDAYALNAVFKKYPGDGLHNTVNLDLFNKEEIKLEVTKIFEEYKKNVEKQGIDLILTLKHDTPCKYFYVTTSW